MAPDETKQSKPSSVRPLRIASAVICSFFGVRRKKDYVADGQDLKPKHIIISAVIGAVLLVMGLMLLMRFVTR